MIQILNISTNVIKGIMFINLEGNLNNETFSDLENNINYLLYKQNMHYFIIDFNNVNYIDTKTFKLIQNKLVEIFLSCGKVALCGLNNFSLKKYCCRDNIVFNNLFDALNHFYI